MRGSDTDDMQLWEMHYTVNTMCAHVGEDGHYFVRLLGLGVQRSTTVVQM